MKVRSGLLVAAGVLAIAAFYAYFEVRSTRRVERVRSAESRVFDFLPDDVVFLRIERGGQSVALERADSGWRLLEPVREAADKEAVGELLQTIGSAAITGRVEENPTNPERYGLGALAARIVVRTASGAEGAVEVGMEAPTVEGVYIRRPGSGAVLLADTPLLTLSRADPGRLVERGAFTGAQELTRLEVRGRDETLVLERTEDGWLVREPVLFQADETRVEETASAFAGLKLDPPEGAPPAAAEAGLSPPRTEIVFHRRGQPEARLLFGAPVSGGRVWVQRDGDDRVFTAEERALALATRKVQDWFETRPAIIDRYQASDLQLRLGGRRLSMVRDAEGWRDDRGRRLPEETVLGLLAALFDSRATAIEERPGRVLPKDADLFVEVRSKNGRNRFVEGWGPDPEGRWRVRQRGFVPLLVMGESYGATVSRLFGELRGQ